MQTINVESLQDTASFISAINKLRLASKNKWYTWVGMVNGKRIELKGYGTWLQIFRVNGLDRAGCPDISVARFKSLLNLDTQ